eukprot:5989281-Pleurochrysis_carterae.AAC.1
MSRLSSSSLCKRCALRASRMQLQPAFSMPSFLCFAPFYHQIYAWTGRLYPNNDERDTLAKALCGRFGENMPLMYGKAHRAQRSLWRTVRLALQRARLSSEDYSVPCTFAPQIERAPGRPKPQEAHACSELRCYFVSSTLSCRAYDENVFVPAEACPNGG